MKKILVVDDEQDIVDIIALLLEGEIKCEVVKANNATDGIEILKSDPSIQAIISDYNMPGGNGPLIYYYNKQNDKLPFGLMSGGELSDYKDIVDFNPSRDDEFFISKPVNSTFLIEYVKQMLKGLEKDIFYGDSHKFKKVDINFVPRMIEKDNQVDIFLKITDEKYIKVFKSEDGLDRKRLLSYKNKGEQYLYLDRDDYEKLCKRSFQTINNRMKKARTAGEALGVSADTINLVYGRLHNVGMKEEEIKLVEENISICKQTLKKDGKLTEIIGNIFRDRGYLVSHSLMSLNLSYMILSEMGLRSFSVLDKFTMAAILHDLTLPDSQYSEIMELSDVRYKNAPPNIQREIFEHPTTASMLLESFTGFHPDVYNLINHHHEKPDGSGFPKKLNASKLPPLSCIFILALKVADHLYHYEFNNFADLKLEIQYKYDVGNFKKPLSALMKRI